MLSLPELHVFQIGDVTVLFPAASIFVNLMNAYDKPEIMPEMKQLAEYAKQKVPEEHPKVINGPDLIRLDSVLSTEVMLSMMM